MRQSLKGGIEMNKQMRFFMLVCVIFIGLLCACDGASTLKESEQPRSTHIVSVSPRPTTTPRPTATPKPTYVQTPRPTPTPTLTRKPSTGGYSYRSHHNDDEDEYGARDYNDAEDFYDDHYDDFDDFEDAEDYWDDMND